MSTRAAVAYSPKDKKGPEDWVGVYSHFDGYPSGLGKKIWDLIHSKKYLGNDLHEIGSVRETKPEDVIQAFINVMIKGHKGGWSSFGEKCYCHDPSFVIRDNSSEEDETDMRLDSRVNPDPLFMEYVYILNPMRKTMTILESKHKPEDKYEKKEVSDKPAKLLKDGYWDYGHCQVKHQLLAVVDLMGKEPKWEELQGWGDEE
jgi:hypothetical protein